MKILHALLVTALLGAGAAFAAPAQVIFIRHAEKPDIGAELSPQGFKRAAALVNFFKTNPAVTRYGAPVAIYAAAPKSEDSSVRSIQTVAPLARALGIDINDSFTRGQTNKLARDIMQNPAYEGRLVLICWQHEKIIDAAQALAEYGGTSPEVYAMIPLAWPSEAFDRVWIMDLKGGKVVAFKNLPQKLLPGDSIK